MAQIASMVSCKRLTSPPAYAGDFSRPRVLRPLPTPHWCQQPGRRSWSWARRRGRHCRRPQLTVSSLAQTPRATVCARRSIPWPRPCWARAKPATSTLSPRCRGCGWTASIFRLVSYPNSPLRRPRFRLSNWRGRSAGVRARRHCRAAVQRGLGARDHRWPVRVHPQPHVPGLRAVPARLGGAARKFGAFRRGPCLLRGPSLRSPCTRSAPTSRSFS